MRGITYEPSRNKWRARFRHEGKQIDLGRFDTELKAKRAVSKKRKEFDVQDVLLDFQKGFDMTEPLKLSTKGKQHFAKILTWLKDRQSK